MAKRPMSKRRSYLYGAALAASTFLFDLWHPLGVAGAMPYIALPLLGLLARSARAIVCLALLGTGLTIAGVYLSAAGASFYVVLLNRGMSVSLIWAVAATALRHLAVDDRLRRTLRNAAFRDALTGLYNRRYVFGIFNNELKRYRRYSEPFSLILIDADHFKHVNDEFGHCAGDDALRVIANVCLESVRDTDVVGRFGGEEFIVLLPHTKAHDAKTVAERIRHTMHEREIESHGRRFKVTLSLGITEVGPNADTFDDVLKVADQALYAAKNGGRDRVAVADGRNVPKAMINAA